MVDSVVTKQELIDAQKDAQSLEDVINGPADTRVKPRIGPEMWTLATINSLVQQGQIKISDLSEAIQIALAAGAGSAGWTANLVADGNQTQKEINLYGGKKYDMPVGGYPAGSIVRLEDGDIVKSTVSNNTVNPNVSLVGWVKTNNASQIFDDYVTQKQINSYQHNTSSYLAIADGTVRTIQEWVDSGKFSNLTAIQFAYQCATSLTDTIDWVACQTAIDNAGVGGTVIFNKTSANKYIINKPLKYYSGQKWQGCGGLEVLGLGTEIKLSTSATSVAEPKNPLTTTYGFNPVGIYFNALNFATVGLSLYNASYSDVDKCAANCTSVNGAGFLFDSDTSKQCYFNKLNIPRAFASGNGGVAFKFVRGANANQIFGGKAGGSYRGAEFTGLSSGNLIIGTDFEENTNCHIYVDVSNNCFIGLHMEIAPIGYDITENGWGTRRIGTTFASTVTVPVRDLSASANTLDYTQDGVGTFQVGNLKQIVTLLSSVININNDINLRSNAESINFNYFRNTNSSSASKKVTFFRGDNTATEAVSFDLATGDIAQTSSTGNKRVIRRAAAVPTAGTWSSGDKVLRTNTNTTNSVVSEWTCVVGGTSGTWAATSWYTGKGVTGLRPTGLTSADVGVQYFDTTLAAAGKPIWWNGSAWVDSSGVIV